MNISEVMTRDVRVIAPDRTVRDAARLMDELNVGVLPVCDGERLVGMITDRDITVRSTAAGIAPGEQRVHEVMSTDLRWCREDDDAGEILGHMSRVQIRRMPVVDRERRLIGIVSLGDLAADRAPGAGEALRRISTPSEPDRSGTPTSARGEPSRNRDRGRLTEDEQRELERRHQARERAERDAARGAPTDAGRGGGGGGDRGNLRFRDEDHIRAAFAGSFNYGESGRGGRMPGGFGGDGYNNYGDDDPPRRDFGTRYAGRDDFGSPMSGGYVRALGYGSEDDFARDDDPGRGRRGPAIGTDAGRAGHTVFSNASRGSGYRDEEGRSSGAHRGRGPRGYSRSADRIREDVSDRLTDDHAVDASEIEIEVSAGEVTLTGTVATRAEKRRAEDVAESVAGVVHVQNNLRVAGQGLGSGGGSRPQSGLIGTPGAAGLASPAERAMTQPSPDALAVADAGTTGGTAGIAAGTNPTGRATGDAPRRGRRPAGTAAPSPAPTPARRGRRPRAEAAAAGTGPAPDES